MVSLVAVLGDEIVALGEDAAMRGEEVAEQCAALLLPHAADDLHEMVEPRVPEDVPHGSGRAGLGIPRPQNHSPYAGQDDGACTHRARLERDNQGAVSQAPLAPVGGGGAQREDLGVGRRVAVRFPTVGTFAEDKAVGSEHDGAHRNVSRRTCLAGKFQRAPHRRVELRAYRRAMRMGGRMRGHVPTVAPAAGTILGLMRLLVIDHPLIAHKLTVLRDERTASPVFRQLVEELVTLLAYEATREVQVEEREITTPVTSTSGAKMKDPPPVVVPILRAGLGMLEGMTRLLPTAEVGFLGMVRDEGTLEAETYANRLPEDMSGRQVFVLDPMLATGGTLVAAIEFLLERGARDVTAICLLAAPEGLDKVSREIGHRAEVKIVTAAVDERLDQNGYIVPGLGDAGDRLYGVVG